MLEFSELERAGVAELADAQDLGSCGLKTVEVQILSPAPNADRRLLTPLFASQFPFSAIKLAA
jgi:hypothetical protein